MDIATVINLVNRLEQTEIRLTESMTVGFQELRELHANTESKLNALIDTVDKLVRRNGQKE
jgi:exonuclease VII small subunit